MAKRVVAVGEELFDAQKFHAQCQEWRRAWESDIEDYVKDCIAATLASTSPTHSWWSIEAYVEASIAQVMKNVPQSLHTWQSPLIDEQEENREDRRQIAQPAPVEEDDEEDDFDAAHPDETAPTPFFSKFHLRETLNEYLQDDHLQDWLKWKREPQLNQTT